MKISSLAIALAGTALLASGGANAALVSTFEDLSLPANSAFQVSSTGSFVSGDAAFHHRFTEFFPGCCADGWTYSNQQDTTTPGFGNQFSAITGGGVHGSANYGVAFLGEARISFAAATQLQGAYFTNTTYTYLAAKNGDDGAGFVKGPFGDGDFLKLTIQGRDASDAIIATQDFLLADGAAVVNAWTWVDLNSLGAVNALTFVMTSSDSGPFGSNTPTYFALDDLTPVPLPPALLLFLSGLAAGGGLVRRRAAAR